MQNLILHWFIFVDRVQLVAAKEIGDEIDEIVKDGMESCHCKLTMVTSLDKNVRSVLKN